MGFKTPLYQLHLAGGAKIVDFGGWDMPLHYGSQIEEHHAVRQKAGMFDVSHMTVVDIDGVDALAYLQQLLANDVARLQPGKALYSAMLNSQAGIIDDLIVYQRSSQSRYRSVVNCGTREKDLAWMQQQAQGFEVSITEQADLAMLAVQGPQACELVAQALGSAAAELIAELTPFSSAELADYFIAKTGYTGEDGLEIILPAKQAVELWQQLAKLDVAAIGLAARDTLRLEAGMNLYGQDIDEQVTPLESNMAWTVAWQPDNRNFNGREALAAQREAGVEHKLVGLVLQQKGVLRAHQQVIDEATGQVIGEITSGTFSPSIGSSIAMARVDRGIADKALVAVRNKQLPVIVVKPNFVRFGKQVF